MPFGTEDDGVVVSATPAVCVLGWGAQGSISQRHTNR